MTADREHLSIRFGYLISGTDEIANTGLALSQEVLPYLGSAANLAELNLSTLGPTLIAALRVHVSGSAGSTMKWADYSLIKTVRIAAVGVDGLEIGDAKIYEDPAPAPGGDPLIVPQCSVVGSLRSGLSTGAANFGRMYFPHTQLGPQTGSPRASGAQATAAVGSFETFISTVESNVNGQLTLGTLEAFIMTQKTGFASKRVAQVAVGRVNDTQRRRRNQLVEEYAFATH
jgi:hypothetical protein